MDKCLPKCNYLFSNVQALCVHFQSYMDDIKIVLSAAKDIIPDPEKILNYMTHALEEMKNMIDKQ